MLRLRIRVTDWPRKALILTDTPQPDCPDCQGRGGHDVDWADYETGEYASTDWDPCDCWTWYRRWALFPLPRRTPNGLFSDEPPF